MCLLGLTGGDVDFGKAFQLLSDGFKTAVDTIMKTDWGKVLGDVANNIIDFLSKVNWVAALTDTGKALLNGLIAAVTADAAAWTKVGAWIYTQLKDLITKTDWSAVWKSFHDALFSTGDWIKTQLVSIGAAIISFFASVKWDQVWNSIS